MDIRQLKQKLMTRSRQAGPALAVVAVSGMLGWYLVGSSDAASFVASQEAEGGVVAGNAGPGETAGASADASVRFGVSPGPSPPGAVTHGEQLTEALVGPWSLQGVAKGQEQLDVVAKPPRGYWRLDTPAEFVPAGTYVYNNNPGNHGGTLAADTMIDGYLVPAGTKVVQFRDLSAADFYAQGMGGTWLFRGVRMRVATGPGAGASMFNDNNATYTNMVHYSDFGGLGPQDGQEMLVAWKMIGGKDHRVLRTYFSDVSTALQPNVAGVELTENYIDKIHFYYGEPGPCGTGGSCTFHLNGVSTEGMSNVTPTRFKFLRNHITIPSPDGAGRIAMQTDAIALFQTNGGSYNDVLLQDNYLGGSGYVIYAGANPNPTSANAPKNVRLIGNKITTRWWTNGGSFGPITAEAPWGTNGNLATGNVWADDYGTGGNGNTPSTARQYPAGNGPRKGQVIFGE